VLVLWAFLYYNSKRKGEFIDLPAHTKRKGRKRSNVIKKKEGKRSIPELKGFRKRRRAEDRIR